MKRTPLWFLPIATVLLAGCPLPAFDSDPPPNGGGGHGDDDDDYCPTPTPNPNPQPPPLPPPASPRSRIDLVDYARILRRDLSGLSRPEQSESVYVSFHAAYNNNRYSDGELGAFANATLKLLNSLDPLSERAGGSGGVAVITDDKNIPLAVRFQPARFNLTRGDIDRIVASSNRQDFNAPFNCDVPAIPVADFLQIASADDFFNPLTENFESTYSNLVVRRLLQRSGVISPADDDTQVFNPIAKAQFIANGFTNISNFTVTDVLGARGADLKDIGLLFNEGNDNERFARACLLNSGVSAANRCFDRFDLPSPVGASAWITWDATPLGLEPNDDFFRALLNGPANPPGDPLVQTEGAFSAAGGEAIFQLPNFMQGYAMFNANLNLVTNPPTLAILNPADGERGNFLSARSCSSCHANYTIPFQDAALNVAFSGPNGQPNEAAGFLFKAVQPQENWDFQVVDDATRYLDELRNVYVVRNESGDLPDGIYTLGSSYLFDLALEDMAAELGLLDADDVEDTLDNITDLTADVRGIFGGGMSRENFTINYQKLVDVTRPDTHDFLRACVTREVSEPGDFGTID